jgi:hypothetical protein
MKFTKNKFPERIGNLELNWTDKKNGYYAFTDIEYVEPSDGNYGDELDYHVGYQVECNFEIISQNELYLLVEINDLGEKVYKNITHRFNKKTYSDMDVFTTDLNKLWEEVEEIL